MGRTGAHELSERLINGRVGTVSSSPNEIAKLFAKMFIARPDVKAVQNSDGEYRPLRGQPFKLPDLLDHLNGAKTYGHYMLDESSNVKLFCFDIDLLPAVDHGKPGQLAGRRRLPVTRNGTGVFMGFQESNPRELWMSRKPGAQRDFIKRQMRTMAGLIMAKISNELEIPTAAAYSGSKGIHVYGFTGKTTAALARQGALLALDSLRDGGVGYWKLARGSNFFTWDAGDTSVQEDPDQNFEQFSLEIFPKQDSLDGKDLGNLLRLPLGVNLKSPNRDRGFFLDMRSALTDLIPRDPIEVLTAENPWA